MSDAEDEDLTAIVEAGEDAVDRSVHPSGIVPVLQCVSSEAKTRAHSRAALDARKSVGVGEARRGNSFGAEFNWRDAFGARGNRRGRRRSERREGDGLTTRCARVGISWRR